MIKVNGKLMTKEDYKQACIGANKFLRSKEFSDKISKIKFDKHSPKTQSFDLGDYEIVAYETTKNRTITRLKPQEIITASLIQGAFTVAYSTSDETSKMYTY